MSLWNTNIEPTKHLCCRQLVQLYHRAVFPGETPWLIFADSSLWAELVGPLQCSYAVTARCVRSQMLNNGCNFGISKWWWRSGWQLLFLFCCSICGIIPGLSSIFLPRMNPFVLIDIAGALALCITYMLIEIKYVQLLF